MTIEEKTLKLAAAKSKGSQMKKALGILIQSAALPDETAAKFPDIYPPWTPGTSYVKDNIVRYEGVLYRVKNSVTADANKPPDKTNSNYQVVKKT